MEALRNALVVLLLTFVLSSAFEICEEGVRTRVQNGTEGRDGSLQAEDGTVYPQNTFWKEDDFWWACPCLSGPCVRICAITFYEDNQELQFIAYHKGKNFYNAILFLEDASNFETDVWENDDDHEKVPLKSLFKFVQLEKETKVCTPPGSEIHLYTKLFTNGSLHYFSSDNNETMKMVQNPDQFCLFPVLWDDLNLAIVCVDGYKFENTIYRWLYPTLFAISIFFLLLTLIAHYLTNKDFNGLHVKCLVNHCISLICYYLVFTILYATGRYEKNEKDVVFGVTRRFSPEAYLTYYFKLVASFWLNVMCYEIFYSCKCAIRKHNLKFKNLALYAWGCPLVLALFVFLVQLALSRYQFLNPKLGFEPFWFSEKLQEFIYYHVLTMALCVSDLLMLVMTARVLRRLQRDNGSANSMYQAELNDMKSRLSLYLKLFLVMGCTWICEFLSFICEDMHTIWMFTDAFINLSGVFIFWINVISNPRVPKVDY